MYPALNNTQYRTSVTKKTDHFQILMAQLFNKTILITGHSKFFYNLIEDFFYLLANTSNSRILLQRQYLQKIINTTFTVFRVHTPQKSEIVKLHPAPHPPNNHSVHQQRQMQHQTPVEALIGG